MRTRLLLFAGVFCVMGLSNAIVPVLPLYGETSAVQGAVYAAYFGGAVLTTLPGGILSDRHGRAPLIRGGLVITVVSGFLLSFLTAAVPVIAARFLEGLGAGLFVAAAMSWVNSLPDHRRMSGWFMASLNGGLITGLVVGGWLAAHAPRPADGIALFAVLVLLPTAAALFVREPAMPAPTPVPVPALPGMATDHWRLWYSAIVLVGITGVLISLWPAFSGSGAETGGAWLSLMSVATIVAVAAVSHLRFPARAAIRWSAVLMGLAVLVSFFTPLGLVAAGGIAGVVMISQMACLSGIRDRQGMAMGVYSTTTYIGMALLPFLAALIVDSAGFPAAFCVTALAALTVAPVIGRATPCGDHG